MEINRQNSYFSTFYKLWNPLTKQQRIFIISSIALTIFSLFYLYKYLTQPTPKKRDENSTLSGFLKGKITYLELSLDIEGTVKVSKNGLINGYAKVKKENEFYDGLFVDGRFKKGTFIHTFEGKKYAVVVHDYEFSSAEQIDLEEGPQSVPYNKCLDLQVQSLANGNLILPVKYFTQQFSFKGDFNGLLFHPKNLLEVDLKKGCIDSTGKLNGHAVVSINEKNRLDGLFEENLFIKGAWECYQGKRCYIGVSKESKITYLEQKDEPLKEIKKVTKSALSTLLKRPLNYS